MSEISYTTQPYSPKLFNSLRPLEDAYQELELRNVSRDKLSSVRSLFHRHKVHKIFGVAILHRHFDMTPEERLVEYGEVTTPWPLSDASEIFGGKIVPRCWAFSGGELYPTEFGFNPADKTTYLDIKFRLDFVRELNELFCQLKIDDLFGLTTLDDGNLMALRGIERTVGRVSITLPIKDDQAATAIESVWTFGCHESLNNSSLWPARICWVCKDCK